MWRLLRRGTEWLGLLENVDNARGRAGAYTDKGQTFNQNEAGAQGRTHSGHHYGHLYTLLAAILPLVSVHRSVYIVQCSVTRWHGISV